MLKTQIDLSKQIPIGREKAALVAQVASRYQCTLTLECSAVVLNVKSMIGLLSQSISKDGQMTLVADGEDEIQASSAVVEALTRKL